MCTQASLDDPTQMVVMHRSEPSRLQSLALQLADKVTNFVDSNERIFEMKSGKIGIWIILPSLNSCLVSAFTVFGITGNFFQRGGQNQQNTGGNQNNPNSQNVFRQSYNRSNAGGGGQDWNRQNRNKQYNGMCSVFHFL